MLSFQPTDKSPLLAEVLFDYVAQRDDELTLKQGGTVEVTARDDEHWWRGRRLSDGMHGLFPANFVQLR